MMKELSKVNRGQEFNFAGIKWIVLDHKEEGTLVLAEDVLEEREFDKNNSNNWKTSSIREYLNGEFLEVMIANGASDGDIKEMTVDLTSDDGMKDYGEDSCKIALLTADQYRKFRSYIKNASDWWWLATPYSCNASYSYLARVVTSDGSLDYDGAYAGYLGVRPACLLSSEIIVETEGEDQEEGKEGSEERVKSDLENEIAEIFKKNTEKGREADVAGVINGVMSEYFRQLETGNWSEKYPTMGYIQKEENKDAASNIINGFLWAMDATGLISDEKRSEMQKQLSALRFPQHSDAYYEEAAAAAGKNKAEKRGVSNDK